MLVRLTRMEGQQATRLSERTITLLAEEYGLDPGEVRHELAQIERRIARYGPEPVEERLLQLAAEFDLDPEEIRAEVLATKERLRTRGIDVAWPG